MWLAWPAPHDRLKLEHAIRSLELGTFWPYLAIYVGLLAGTHLFRAWRWIYLLRPIGAEVPTPRLLAISSVGFMAILALPARLGEFVRPALLREKGKISASAVLGTVAVERIVDGLLVSLLVFACSIAVRGPKAPGWMMPTAYLSLGVFVSAMTFLAFAHKWPTATVRLVVTMSGARRFAPRLATRLEDALKKLISGFLILKDARNLALFGFFSAVYWGLNGLSMWILARGMGLELSPIGAFATMGIVAVGITLPNSPGNVGQFHWFTVLGLSLYLPRSVADSAGLAYAILLHGTQVVWYLGVGAACMLTSHISWREIASARDAEALSL